MVLLGSLGLLLAATAVAEQPSACPALASVRVEVRQQLQPAGLQPLPLDRLLGDLFAWLGARSTTGAVEAGGAELVADVHGRADGAEYSMTPGARTGLFHYTGGVLTGTMELRQPGKESIRHSFESRRPVGNTISSGIAVARRKDAPTDVTLVLLGGPEPFDALAEIVERACGSAGLVRLATWHPTERPQSLAATHHAVKAAKRRLAARPGKDAAEAILAAFRRPDRLLPAELADIVARQVASDPSLVETLVEIAIAEQRDPDSAWAGPLDVLAKVRAIQPLIVVMQRASDDDVVGAAAFHLGWAGDRAAIPALIDLLGSPRLAPAARARAQAALALERLTGQRLGEDADSWRQWWTRQAARP